MKVNPPASSGLVRALGLNMATAVVVGSIIGTGIFLKPRTVAENVHFFGLAALVWIAGGILTLLGALTYAEVLALYPRAGGNYVLLREGYGRIFGFLWGWVDFFIMGSATVAAAATVFAESLNDVLGNAAFADLLGIPRTELAYWPQKLMTAGIILVFTFINIRGVKLAGGLNLFLTLLKMAMLLTIIVLPFIFWGRQASTLVAPPTLANLSPAWPDDWSKVTLAGITTALLGVLWAYNGFSSLGPVAEEVRDPHRNIPVALFAGMGIVLALYLGANFAYALLLPQSEMAQLKESPVATLFCLRLLGPLGGTLMSVSLMFSAFGSFNGSILFESRVPFAMGRDGLLPRAFGQVHPRYRTPAVAVLALGLWSALLVLLVATLSWKGVIDPQASHFDILTDYFMFGSMTFESLAVLSIFVFRWKYPHAERPYRCWGYPVVPAVFGLVCACLLVNMFSAKPMESLAGLAFIVVGVMFYPLARFGNRAQPTEAPTKPDG